MLFSVKEAIGNYIEGCSKKTGSENSVIVGKAVFAGMMIAMGAAGSNVAVHAIPNVGIARLVAGLVFPVGLMMVILLGAELFTGDCLMAMAVPENKISLLQLIRVLVLVYIGNMLGATLIALMTFACGQFDYSGGLLGAYTLKVALGKATLPVGRAFISGILCNILVCAAVLMAGCAKDVTGKLLVSFFVIMLFVTSGFEHCVANMYYISAGLFAKLNPDYVSLAASQYGIDASMLKLLNIKTYLVDNLIPVTIGNIVGGMVTFGLPLYFLNNGAENKNAVKKKESEEKENGYYPNNVVRTYR